MESNQYMYLMSRHFVLPGHVETCAFSYGQPLFFEDALIMWLSDLFDERVRETIEETNRKFLLEGVKND